MQRRTLNLGILAHVDAGKTTLTERLLYAAGVIDEIGSVDAGTTQTDSLDLERQRGITIRSAVVSFSIDDVSVNLIDTPGHPDFIAEVERVLSVLDGAILVISAVEGVQPQTRVLMRALQRLRVPTLLFVNKIDRRGADHERVLRAVADRLTAAAVPMGSVDRIGTRAARFTPWADDDLSWRTQLTEALAGQNDELLAAYVENDAGCHVSTAAGGALDADETRPGASRLLWLRHHRRGCGLADGRDRGLVASFGWRCGRPVVGARVQDRTWIGGREGRVAFGCSPARSGHGTACSSEKSKRR